MISVELTLLSAELVLLIFTVILLRLHLREERSRQDMIRELSRTTSVLTRQAYFSEVMNSLQAAKKSIFGCITGSRPAEGERQIVDNIIKNIHHLTQSGVKIRFTLPKFPDRLYIGYRYSAAGSAVRYSNCILVNDLRYMVVDDRFIVIGVPEVAGEKEPIKKGYKIPSMGISAILREHYDRCWKSRASISYEEYVKDIIEDVKRAEPSFSFEPLSRELGIDIDELKRIDTLKMTPSQLEMKIPEEHL